MGLSPILRRAHWSAAVLSARKVTVRPLDREPQSGNAATCGTEREKEETPRGIPDYSRRVWSIARTLRPSDLYYGRERL